MTDEHKSTRLGDLLVERGVITRAQLTHAVELQQIRRQHAIKVNAPNSYTQELGELLIELGFINRSQLKSGLSWQKRLRKTTAAMVFIAPLLTAACGGGGGGTSAGSGNTQAPTLSAQTITSEPANAKPVSFSSVTAEPGQDISLVSSSMANSSASVPSSSFSTTSSSSSSAAMISGPVQVYWTPPKQRENGDYLDITELGGYVLRYKRKSEAQYTSIIIKDSYADAYYFDDLQGEYEFQIAAFDINGVHSPFVQVKPM